MRSLDVSLTKEQKAIVRKLRLEKKMSAKTIWKETGIPRHRVEAFINDPSSGMELRPYTEEQEKAVCELKASGKTSDQIAKHLGIKRCSVLRVIKKHGLSEKTLIGESKIKAVDLFKSGVSILDIATSLNCRYANVLRAIRLAGIEVKTRKSPLSESEKRAALEMYTPEIGVSEVARRLNISRAQVDKLLKSNGIRVISNSETRAIPKEDREKLENLYWEEGWTAEEIGVLYSTRSNVVTKFFKKNGIRARSQSESTVFLGHRIEREIVKGYLEGHSLVALAAKFDKGEIVIRNKLVEMGVYVTPVKPAPLTEVVKEIVRRMYVDDAVKMADIVKQFPVNRAELTAYLISIKISRKDRKFTAELCDRICKIYRDGDSVKYICRLLQCSPEIVKEILTENGIAIRESVEQIFRWRHRNSFISGFYKNIPFRSSTELSFVIGYLERFGIAYESGEVREWSVPYVDPEGKSRTYYPDFVLTDKKMVIEIKPKCFWASPIVVAKKKTAEIHFAALGFKYQLVAYPTLYKEIVARYVDKEIVFHDDRKFRTHMLVQQGVNMDDLIPRCPDQYPVSQPAA